MSAENPLTWGTRRMFTSHPSRKARDGWGTRAVEVKVLPGQTARGYFLAVAKRVLMASQLTVFHQAAR